ncbi:hypothetical protein [Brevifollis gellanilyticus]|nr:hypothetical protein [Brevifollis gellanilyticus]
MQTVNDDAAAQDSSESIPAVVFNVSEAVALPHFKDETNLVNATYFQRDVGIYVGLARRAYFLRIEPMDMRSGWEMRGATVSNGNLNIECFQNRKPSAQPVSTHYYGVVCSKEIQNVNFHYFKIDGRK